MTLQAAVGQTAPILLIEDEPSVIAFLKAALERKGIHRRKRVIGRGGFAATRWRKIWRGDLRHSHAGRGEWGGST